MDGVPRGFDVEMLDGFCKLTGLRMQAASAPNHDAALAALLAGQGDVWAVLSARDPSLQLGMLLGRRQSLANAVRQDAPQLVRALDENTNQARSSPLWSQLLARHFGSSVVGMLKLVRE